MIIKINSNSLIRFCRVPFDSDYTKFTQVSMTEHCMLTIVCVAVRSPLRSIRYMLPMHCPIANDIHHCGILWTVNKQDE